MKFTLSWLHDHLDSTASAAETAETSSPSMDISKASNFERFIFDLMGRDGDVTRANMAANGVDGIHLIVADGALHEAIDSLDAAALARAAVCGSAAGATTRTASTWWVGPTDPIAADVHVASDDADAVIRLLTHLAEAHLQMTGRAGDRQARRDARVAQHARQLGPHARSRQPAQRAGA